MEKQDEYDIRQTVHGFISNEISNSENEYFRKHENNIGFLMYYPLIKIEKRFIESDPNFALVEKERIAIGWFIRKMLSRITNTNLVFTYKQNEFNEFENNYPLILNLYMDFQLSKLVLDMRSISKMVIEVNNDLIVFKSPIVEDEYEKEHIYFWRLGEEQAAEYEEEQGQKVVNHLISNYSCFKIGPFNKFIPHRPGMQATKRLHIDIDTNLLDLSINRVGTDLRKLGESVKSPVIDCIQSLKKIVGFLYYLGHTLHYQLQANMVLGLQSNFNQIIVQVQKEWLIKKIHTATGLLSKSIERYLDYFTLNPNFEGGLAEFPLVTYGDLIVFPPVNVMLNDWHITLVNGHYYKDIKFHKRDETIAKNIINGIIDKAMPFENITCCSNKYYEFFNDKGIKQNSDIDVALYDELSNTILIIECKWKENIYLDRENYINLEDALNKIYSKQLLKHKEFLDNYCSNIIDYLFSKDHNQSVLNIFYIAVDKRSQLHTEEKHMLSLNILLKMIDDFSDNNTLNLDGLINDINSLKTIVNYQIISSQVNEIIYQNKTVIVSGLSLNYS